MSRVPVPMHSQQPPGVIQNWSTLQCSKQNTEQCGYDHAPVTRGRMRAQFPLPHGPPPPTRCSHHLRLFFRRFNVKLMSQMLVCPLTLTLVEAALASLNQTSSPVIDGFPCAVYSKFQSHFSPRMLQITQRTVDEGKLNPEWAEALVNLIPKGRGIVQVADYRPLVLQNTAHKWIGSNCRPTDPRPCLRTHPFRTERFH